MTLKIQGKSAATLAGTAFVAAFGAGYAVADTHHAEGFAAHELDGGYLLAAKADTEGKCGEGKCGESKSDAEGKCGEDKSGDAKSDAEGKCGEGKCGSSGADTKDSAEGKCGEGKCGGAA